jgi:hypothetical protein
MMGDLEGHVIYCIFKYTIIVVQFFTVLTFVEVLNLHWQGDALTITGRH